MKNHQKNPAEKSAHPAIKKEIPAGKRAFWDIGATIGLLGGVWFFLSAIFMTISEFLFSEHPRGSWMFLAVLPLWVFGALCYDKVEDAEKQL